MSTCFGRLSFMTAKSEDEMPGLSAKLNVGDPVMVYRPRSRYRSNDPIPAAITKIGRVWVEMHAPDNGIGRTWRMRMDTQDEGNGKYSHYNASFYTPEQQAWKQKLREADEFLRDQGIEIGSGGGWALPSRRVFLANLIREAIDLIP